MSIGARSNRCKSTRSRICSTAKVVDGTGTRTTEVISNKGTKPSLQALRPSEPSTSSLTSSLFPSETGSMAQGGIAK